MRPKPLSKNFLDSLINRTGGWFIIAVIALAQIWSIPGTILGIFIVQTNIELAANDFQSVAALVLGLLILNNLVLLVVTYYTTRSAFTRLESWKSSKTLTTGTTEEARAWQEINRLPWYYAVYAFIGFLVLMLVPTLLFLIFSIKANLDQVVHTIFGGLVSILGIVVISSFVIERMLFTAREILMPRNFEAQIAGATGLKAFIKFQVATLTLIVIAILLIAPVGYSSVIKAINSPGESAMLTTRIQVLSIIGSVLALLFGAIVSYMLASSVSRSVNDLVKVFALVEQGQLSSRAKVISTDEVGELAVYFNRMVSRLEQLQQNLEGEVAIRTAQIEASNEIGRITSSILDPDELATKIVNLVTEKLGFYHAALFLVDENGVWVDFVDGTGEAGRVLKEKHFRLPIATKSMVTTAIATRQAQVASDVDRNTPDRLDSPLLPETRSEIALPLLVGEQVLGVLDVQSKKPSAFGEREISTLQNMANQVAVAIENARLFNSTQRLLEEMRLTNAQYIAQSWNAIGRGMGKLEFETKTPAPASNELFAVDVPLTLRDQILGKITIEGEADWSPEQRNLLESIANQAAFALENARLLSESQQTALRERLAASITEKIWSTPSIDGILQTAVRELGKALETTEASIELKTEE